MPAGPGAWAIEGGKGTSRGAASGPRGVEVPGVMSLCQAGRLRTRVALPWCCGCSLGVLPSDSSPAPCNAMNQLMRGQQPQPTRQACRSIMLTP